MEVRDEEAVEAGVEAEEEDRWGIIPIRHLCHTRVGHLPHTRMVHNIQYRAHTKGARSISSSGPISGARSISSTGPRKVSPLQWTVRLFAWGGTLSAGL